MMKPTLTAVLFFLNIFTLTAQSITPAVVNSSGNTYAKGYYSLDWSVGELALVSTLQSINGSNIITSGFLQPNDFKSKNSDFNSFSDDEIRILPNPTYNNIEINFFTSHKGVLSIYVYDATGKNLLVHKAVSNGIGSIERINLSLFAAGTYLLKIELNPYSGSVWKTGSYKIVKLS